MTVSWTRKLGAVGLMLTLACGFAACSGGGAAVGRSPDKRLSDAEYRYGASVKRNGKVELQPNVVVPGGGADSVKSVSSDGLTWTLDGDAPEVDRLKVGSLLMVTSRGCGRVLGVKKVDGDVAVTIGPAALTDFISDIDTSYSGAIDPKLVQFRVAPGRPSAADVTNHPDDADEHASTTSTTAPPTTIVGKPAVDGPRTRPASFLRPTSEPELVDGRSDAVRPRSPVPSLPTPKPGAKLPLPSAVPVPVIPVTGMKVYPLHGSDGSWGLELGYDKHGLRIKGSARVYLKAPKIEFGLKIVHGRIITAEVSLSGVAGVRGEFEAATSKSLTANIHQIIDLPLDISMPIFGPGLPFSATFHQAFKIDSVFSAKDSSLRFDGDYSFHGKLRAGYRDGAFQVAAPAGFSVRKSLVHSVDGVSIGVNGFIIAHELRLIVGIGGFGFAVGPYVSLITAMGVTNGSNLAIVKCSAATLDMSMGYGIGYVIPQAVTDVINVFLRALNLKQIHRSGGTKPQLVKLIHKDGFTPKLKICEGAV